MAKQDRQKASDIFRESTYVFSQKVPFADAFPEISRVSIQVIEVNGFHKVSFENPPGYPAHSMFYNEKNVGEFIDCHNTICYNGGFGIGSILRDMVRTRETGIAQTVETAFLGRYLSRDDRHSVHFYSAIYSVTGMLTG